MCQAINKNLTHKDLEFDQELFAIKAANNQITIVKVKVQEITKEGVTYNGVKYDFINLYADSESLTEAIKEHTSKMSFIQ